MRKYIQIITVFVTSFLCSSCFSLQKSGIEVAKSSDSRTSSLKLIHPQEVWQTKSEGVILTFTLVSIAFSKEDIENERFSDMGDNLEMISGILVNKVEDVEFPKNCPHPRFPLATVNGVRKKDGRIVLWSNNTVPFFSGTINHFKSAGTFEISKPVNGISQLTMSYMLFNYSNNPLVAKRIVSEIKQVNLSH